MVKKKKKKKKDSSIIFSAIAIIFFILMILYIWIYNRVNVTMEKVVDLRRTEKNLQEMTEELKAKLSNLSRSDRITRTARNRLGMVFPVPETQLIYNNYPGELPPPPSEIKGKSFIKKDKL